MKNENKVIEGYHLIQDLSLRDELYGRKKEFIGRILTDLQIHSRDTCTGYYECYGYIDMNPIYFKAVKLKYLGNDKKVVIRGDYKQ